MATSGLRTANLGQRGSRGFVYWCNGKWEMGNGKRSVEGTVSSVEDEKPVSEHSTLNTLHSTVAQKGNVVSCSDLERRT